MKLLRNKKGEMIYIYFHFDKSKLIKDIGACAIVYNNHEWFWKYIINNKDNCDISGAGMYTKSHHIFWAVHEIIKNNKEITLDYLGDFTERIINSNYVI